MRLIDADALIKKCGDWYTEEGPEEGFIGTIEMLVNEQPVIKPRQGEWVSLHNGKWKCSECGIEVLIYAKGNYCPNCGADMRGGGMRMIRDLTEMNKLEDYLKANGFEYQREDEDAEPMDKHQIIVFDDGVRSWDVVCHYGSYGCDEGLLEGMGDLFGPDVDGYLTAEDVIKKIEEVRS